MIKVLKYLSRLLTIAVVGLDFDLGSLIFTFVMEGVLNPELN